jgi:hypothetical protein
MAACSPIFSPTGGWGKKYEPTNVDSFWGGQRSKLTMRTEKKLQIALDNGHVGIPLL